MSCPATFGTITVPSYSAVRVGSPPVNHYTSIWFQLGSRPSSTTTRVTITSLVISPSGLPQPSKVFHLNQTEIWYTPTNWTNRQQIMFPMYKNLADSATKLSTTKFYLVRFTARITWGNGRCFSTSSTPIVNTANVTVRPSDTVIPACFWTPTSPQCWYFDFFA